MTPWFESGRLSRRATLVLIAIGGVLLLAGATIVLEPWYWGRLAVRSSDPPGTAVESCTLHMEDRAETIADYFGSLDYTLPQVRQQQIPVPRIFLSSLPSNLEQQPEVDYRKRIFLRAVLPLVLGENERLQQLRQKLLDLRAAEQRGDSVTRETKDWLEDTFELFNAEPGDWETLLRRVDVIPVSLALAQAAVESGWGLSRFAQEGNSLFGQWTWKRRQSGLVPGERDDGERYRVRAFPTLQDSVASYMHNLNSHWAYQELRARRAKLRKSDTALSGMGIVEGLHQYSVRGADYVRELRHIIRANNLQQLDPISLAEHRVDCNRPSSALAGTHVVLVAASGPVELPAQPAPAPTRGG